MMPQPRDREKPGCPSPETGRSPTFAASSSTAERNRERDAWDDYLDALYTARLSHSLRDAYLVAVLFGRWLALRR